MQFERSRLKPFLIWTLSILIFDRLSKVLVERFLHHILEWQKFGFAFRLQRAENPGAFLSLGANLDLNARLWLFVGIVFLIVIFCMHAALKCKPAAQIQFLGLTLLGAGGLGNLIDRMMHGSVTDFMWISVLGLHTGVFNVADMAIMSGVCLMIAEGLGLKIPVRHKQNLN